MISPSQRTRVQGRGTAPGQQLLEFPSNIPRPGENYNTLDFNPSQQNQIQRTRVNRNNLERLNFGNDLTTVPGALVVKNPQVVSPQSTTYSTNDDNAVVVPNFNSSQQLNRKPDVTVTDIRQDPGVLNPDNDRKTYPTPLWDIRQAYINCSPGLGPNFEGYKELAPRLAIGNEDPLINPLGRVNIRKGNQSPNMNDYAGDYNFNRPPFSRQRINEYIHVNSIGNNDNFPYRTGQVGNMPADVQSMIFQIGFLYGNETHPDKRAQLSRIVRQLESHGQKMNSLENVGSRTSLASTIPKVRRIFDDNGKEYQSFSPSIDPKKVSVNIGKDDEIVVTGVVFPPMEVINKSSGPLDSEAIRKYIRWMLIFLIIAVILIILYCVYRFARWLFCWEDCGKCKGKKGKCSC